MEAESTDVMWHQSKSGTSLRLTPDEKQEVVHVHVSGDSALLGSLRVSKACQMRQTALAVASKLATQEELDESA